MSAAVIIPYRNREEHLKQLLPALRERLPTASIYIIEQMDDLPFNRGALLNMGVIISSTADYYIFHDVDLVPVEVDYSMQPNPTSLAADIKGRAGKPFFGGVSSIRADQFFKTGGYSNKFWGWCCEDDSYCRRIENSGLVINYRKSEFIHLYHEPEKDETLYKKNMAVYYNNEPSNTDGLYHVMDMAESRGIIKYSKRIFTVRIKLTR